MSNACLLNIKELKNGTIDLKGKAGLIKIRQIEDTGEVILDTDNTFNKVGSNYFNVLSLLSLFLNKGFKIEKTLTFNGFYLPLQLFPRSIPLSGDNYNPVLFENYYKKINILCSSNITRVYQKGTKIKNMLSIYNNSFLMLPNFYDESYLNLIRILDFHRFPKNSDSFFFPDKTIRILSRRFVKEIYKRIQKNDLYENHHIPTALKLFNKIQNQIRAKVVNYNLYNTDAIKFFYIVLYVLYQYRNKFVHDGFPFPGKIKYQHTGDLDTINYFDISVGESHITGYNPYQGFDIHMGLNQSFEKEKGREFKRFYLLLPKWYFLNQIVREVIFCHLKKL